MIKTVLNEPVYDTDAVNKGYLDKKLSSFYPVGSIYMNLNLIDPSLIFGGTWERLKDTFLLGAGDTYEAGTSGGEAEVVLTKEQLPKHNHVQTVRNPSSDSLNPAGTGKDGSERVGEVEYRSGVSYQLANQEKWAAGYTINTYSTGSNVAHNNMPPYLTVYIWKRIA